MQYDRTITRQDLQTLRRDLTREIVDEIGSLLVDMMSGVGMHFHKLESNFQSLESRLDALEADVKDLKITVNRMEQKLDPTIDRMDGIETKIIRLEARVL